MFSRRDLLKLLGGGLFLQRLNNGTAKIKEESPVDDFYSMVSDMKQELKTKEGVQSGRYLQEETKKINDVYFNPEFSEVKLIRELAKGGISVYRDPKLNKVRLFHLGKLING